LGEQEKVMNSREKGARGERELANFLKDHGYPARRGQQFSGANGDADVEGLAGVHIECKRVEKLNIDDAMEQSERDSYADSIKQGKRVIPTVFHRRNGKKWKVTMYAEDFLNIYRRGVKNE
jgi:Holliday junction resolvase